VVATGEVTALAMMITSAGYLVPEEFSIAEGRILAREVREMHF
jgi:hypothetical protein